MEIIWNDYNISAYTHVPETLHKLLPSIPLERLMECYSTYKTPLMLGQVTHYSMWDEFCSEVGREISLSILKDAFLQTPINFEMIDLVKELSLSYLVGIISNNSIERMNIILEYHRINELFSSITLSSMVGSTKNTETIFKKALEKDSSKPFSSVFIDNHETCLVVPQKLGFKTYLFNPVKNDVQRLRKKLNTWGIDVTV